MTWLKVDDTVTEHPKCVGLSPAAWTLWLHGLTYCSRNLTDGHIPAVMLPRLSSIQTPKKAAQELTQAGLWHETSDGWEVHDYTEHQRSKADIETERAAARERRSRARKG